MRAVEEFLKKDRFAAHNGIELLAVAEGYAKARMPIQEHHLNSVDVVHGSAIFALADLAFTAASHSHETVAVGINASISYVQPATKGTLFAEAKEVSLGPELASYAIEITNQSNEIVAAFEGVVYRSKQAIGRPVSH